MATVTETQTMTPEKRNIQLDKPKSIQPPVPYHVPTLIGTEADNVHSASLNTGLAGGGEFTKRITEWLEKDTEQSRTFLTNSCTRALEMAALLCGLRPGDEVILCPATRSSQPSTPSSCAAHLSYLSTSTKTP